MPKRWKHDTQPVLSKVPRRNGFVRRSRRTCTCGALGRIPPPLGGMTEAIYHYPLPVEPGPFALLLPEGAHFLHCGERDGRPVAYYRVNPASKPKSRALYMAYT